MSAGRLAVAAFLAGAVLMVVFESGVTRIAGVLALFSAIALGAYAIGGAPELLEEPPGRGDQPPSPPS